MQLYLQAMTTKHFSEFLHSQIQEYAHQKVLNHLWPAEQAQQRAQEDFQMLLPDGLNTYHNYFYVISASNEIVYGYVWLAEVMDSDQPNAPYLFINDYAILPAYQDQGYGQQGLKLVFQEARRLGYHQLGLHVFGENQRAQHLYQKMGFFPTDIVMKKTL
ncbi:GNAT family N-acetyltransferase [Bombilactobacillus bombi]|uniref:GNAT family N-acetyltransferase n=1 Tax=Bombilactobacillus bombi TaxID=1303590 RepID=UPI0015E5F93B|nr:GNAT family N-acetyltransferase [Bombilactobacillus bombi]MBA1435113.1 GNAT family N-acetyltransferase [Bombilactobacillus bombi]